MAFTGVLGKIDSNLGSFSLGRVGTYSPPPLDVGAGSTLSLSHSVAVSTTLNVSGSNTLVLVQSLRRQIDVAAVSTLVLTQDATVLRGKFVDAANVLTVSQLLSRELTFNRSVNQAIVLTQLAEKTTVFNRSITSPLTLAQANTSVATKQATNTLVLTQLAEYDYSRGARSTLVLTQSVARSMIYNRPTFSNFIPFHAVVMNGVYKRPATSTLVLTQVAVGIAVKFVSNMLVLSQSATCEKVTPAFSQLVFMQAASVNMTLRKRLHQYMFLVQNVSVQKSTSVSASNALGMSQFARATRVLNVSVGNTLALVQNVVQQRYNESLSQSLTLTQVATVQKIVTQRVANTLVLGQTLGLSKTIVRSVSDVLVFKDSHEKRTGITSHPIVMVPSAQYVLRKNVTSVPGAYPRLPKCVVILQGTSTVITLPCPEFNDAEAGMSKLNIKRAMDGTRRVYRRESPTNKLKYDFVMDRKKAIELRTFLLANNSTPVYLTNHKGELWYVLITNTPFTFVETAYWNSDWGNKSTITLEFEGARLT